MVSIWIKSPLGATLDADGVVRLSDGREFSLSSISGGAGWNAQKLARLNAAAQALFDTRTPLTSLPADDPARLANPGLPYWYWSDADGNPVASGATHITARHTLVSFTHDGTRLIPMVTEVS